jgi:8-oxo-dGTP pyrophosphatase MutT (NUDIX family)
MQTKYHNTAGCYLVRKIERQNSQDVSKNYEIILIFKDWAKDNQAWVPPKGHVEKGESLESAAIRETREETGYKNMRIIAPIETLHIKYEWDDGFLHDKKIHYFLAELLDEEKVEKHLSERESSSQRDEKWFTLKEALNKLGFDDERELLEKVIKMLEDI